MTDEEIENRPGEDAGVVAETVVEAMTGRVSTQVPIALVTKIGAKKLPWLLGAAATAGFVVDEIEEHRENGDTCKAIGAALAGTAETIGNSIPFGNNLFLGDAFHKVVREPYIWMTESVLGFEESQCTPNETDILAAADYLFSDNAQSMGIRDENPQSATDPSINVTDDRLAP